MSDSNSQSTTSQQTQQADNRVVLGQGALLAQSGSSIAITNTTLDGDVALAAINGSVKGEKLALDFGETALSKAFSFAGTSEQRAFSFASASEKTALDSLQVQSNLVKDAYADAKGRGALTDKILIGSIAMAGLVAIAALRK